MNGWVDECFTAIIDSLIKFDMIDQARLDRLRGRLLLCACVNELLCCCFVPSMSNEESKIE